MTELEPYNTPDLYLAAFMQTAKHKMARTKIQGKRLIFYFAEETEKDLAKINRELEELESAYFKADGLTAVTALEYANNIKSLKTLCHSILKRSEG